MSQLDGFLVINKPAGITSHDVVAFARRRLKIERIGHTGTLDPLATGVLVLGVNQGTKLIEYLVGTEKEYEAEITFGVTSETYDREGTITPTPEAVEFERVTLEKVLPEFTGEILQVPPAYSALKLGGKTAHARARAGETVELSARRIHIHELTLTKFRYPKIELHVHCGSGTYIRSLAHDLGKRLETGALLSRLTRTRAGNFLISQAIPLTKIRPEKVLPLDVGVVFPRVNLTAIEAEKIRTGQKIPCRLGDNCAPQLAGFFDDRLLAILVAEPAKRTLKSVKGFN